MQLRNKAHCEGLCLVCIRIVINCTYFFDAEALFFFAQLRRNLDNETMKQNRDKSNEGELSPILLCHQYRSEKSCYDIKTGKRFSNAR